MTIIIYIGLGVISLYITHVLTIKGCQKESDEEIAKCCEKYDREISQLKGNLEKEFGYYKSLKSKYEELLTSFKSEEERYYKTLTQKCNAERRIADLKNELYCARKRTTKLTTQFVSILSKLLGIK